MFVQDIAEFLIANGFGELRKNIFYERMPEKSGVADNAIAVIGTPSTAYNRELNSIDYTCQIRVRNLDVEAGEKIAYDIYKLIYNTDKEIVVPSGKRFIVRPTNPPYLIDMDTAFRYIYMINIVCLSDMY